MTMMTCLPVLLAHYPPLLSDFLATLAVILCLFMLLIEQPESKEVIMTIILSISPIYLILKSTMMTIIIKLIPYFLSLPLSHFFLLVASSNVHHPFCYLWFLPRFQRMIGTKKKKDPPSTLANIQPPW